MADRTLLPTPTLLARMALFRLKQTLVLPRLANVDLMLREHSRAQKGKVVCIENPYNDYSQVCKALAYQQVGVVGSFLSRALQR